MDYYYLDASVLVKAYVWEVGTVDVLRVLRDARATAARARVITSRIAFTEAMSAVSRREAAGELTRADANVLEARLRADFTGPVLPYVVLDSGRSLVHHAADLTRRHRLRALDAIHLATSMAARFNAPAGMNFHFGSADRRLNAAAVREGLTIFDPQAVIPTGTGTPIAPPV
ncbi:MAG TPA: type II toxin-antitoxin system VapC family toxin [Longimicrobium sp.]|nr:type II toxin-antitoxin system VapC family toxin [Longimicrobium sp.]